MKHLKRKILVVLAVTGLLLSASRPSMDGRALVADENALPSGMFAKSAAYLPGDSVIVTNPAANVSVEVMIFGIFDASEGVAIVLSPEAAKKLYIEKDSNSVVVITRSGIKASENSLLSDPILKTEKLDSDKEPMAHVDDTIEEVATGEVVSEETVTDEVVVEESVTEETGTDNEAITIAEDSSEDEVFFSPFADENIATKDDIALVEEEIIAEEEIADPVAEPVIEAAEPVVEETEPVVEEEIIEEVAEPLISDEAELFVVETKPVIEDAEPVVEDAESVIEDAEPVVEDAEPVVEDAEPVIEDAEPVVEDFEKNPAIEDVPVDDREPNVLVPAFSKPPEKVVKEEVVEEIEEPENSVIVLEPIELSEEEILRTEMQINDPLAFLPALEEPLEVEEFSDVILDDYLIESTDVLGKDSYYIQLATYKNSDNVRELIDQYAKKYPIKLVKYEKLDAYRIIVGPLNIDEYPIVMKRFMTWGFKDAFLRKIK